jgi:hypothetical protein
LLIATHQGISVNPSNILINNYCEV